MRLCAKDWDRIRRAFGFEEIDDVAGRLRAVIADYRFDPWLAANVCVIKRLTQSHRVHERWPSPRKFQAAVKDGCPVCLVRDFYPDLLDDAIADVKASRFAGRPAWMGRAG